MGTESDKRLADHEEQEAAADALRKLYGIPTTKSEKQESLFSAEEAKKKILQACTYFCHIAHQ